MSTKSTLVSGKAFHLFEECFDPAKNVWLDLTGCAFEATSESVRVEIPLAVWEIIRQHTPARYDLAPLTDAQLLAEAEKRVDTLRAEYRIALAEHKTALKTGKGKVRRKTFFSLLYRDARLPRDEHLASVLEKLRAERAAQRKLKRAVARQATRRQK